MKKIALSIITVIVIVAIISFILIVNMKSRRMNEKIDISNSFNIEDIQQENIVQSGEKYSEENNTLEWPIINNSDISYEEMKLENEGELIEHYKISDSYFLSEFDEVEYNIIKRNEIINDNYIFVSDEIDVEVKCEKNDYNIDIKLNGNDLKVHNVYKNCFENVGKCLLTINVGVIDLDETDDFKEIVIRGYEDTGLSYNMWIYRVRKNGLELIFERIDAEGYESFIKIGDKYIVNTTFYVGNFNFTYGYYIYEDGVFKFINRFATGERIIDENGIFPENFQKLEFKTGGYYEGFCMNRQEDPMTLANTRFCFIGFDIESYTYKIKVLDDTYFIDSIGETDVKEFVAEGTILENLKSSMTW